MRKNLSMLLVLAGAVSACGDFNLNEALVSKSQENSIDSLVQEAQYEYDKGRYDNALSLTNKALAINPHAENPTILKSYVYLSKAGLDGINISRKLIAANDKSDTTTTTASGTTPAKTGDTTTDNFNIIKSVLNLQTKDFEAMGTPATIGAADLTIYYPKTAPEARKADSGTLEYLNLSIATMCPLVLSSANPDTLVDARHDCTKNPYASGEAGRTNFGWALAHLGEAITFYSTILYDSNGDGIPNIQAAIPTEALTAANATTYIKTLNSLNLALNSIFPTDPTAAANSMLNGLFGDLETTSTALSAIPGIPSEVADSVKKSIDDLNTKIASINTAATGASAQNEALKNSLTTGMAKTVATQIDSTQFKTQLDTQQQAQACCVYRNMNSSATMPNNCSAATYNDASCAALLAQ